MKIANEIIKVNNSIWEDEKKIPKGNFSFDELRWSIVSAALSHFDINDYKMIEWLESNYSSYKHEAIYVFENVLNMFHIQPHEACMIGDHYLWEVVAPISYGLIEKLRC